MEIVSFIMLVILGCQFPGLLIDVLKMSPEDKNYRERRYTLGLNFGAILFFLVLALK